MRLRTFEVGTSLIFSLFSLASLRISVATRSLRSVSIGSISGRVSRLENVVTMATVTSFLSGFESLHLGCSRSSTKGMSRKFKACGLQPMAMPAAVKNRAAQDRNRPRLQDKEAAIGFSSVRPGNKLQITLNKTQ